MPARTMKLTKRVHFEMTDYGDVRTYRFDSPYLRSDLIDESLWWSPVEYSCIRSSAQLLTTAVRNGDDCEDYHGRKNSYRKSLSRAYKLSQKNSELPRNCKEDLAFWVNLGDARRGLEKFMLEDMKRDREKKREKVTAAVKAAQERAMERRMGRDQAAEAIAAASKSNTKCAKRFARVMAMADEYAASVEKHALTGLAKDAPSLSKPAAGARSTSWRRRKYSPAA